MKPTFSTRISQGLNRLSNDFQLSVIVILTVFVSMAISPFMILRLINGQILVFILDILMIIGTVVIAIYAWQSQKTERAAMILAISTTTGMVLTALYNPAPAPYWLYCMVLFSFALIPPRPALLFSCIGSVAVVTQPDAFVESTHRASFIVTIIATILFAFIFAKRNEHQRNILMKRARTDVLTNIGNRRAFNEEFAIALSALNRHRKPTALVLLDVDHFKRINDENGHDVGDEVLIKLVQSIQNNIRPGDRFFRTGGEEFCLILEESTRESAIESMNRLRTTIESTTLLMDKIVTVSLGITHLTTKDTLEKAMKRADDALYNAKNSGRNIVVYSPS